jgi:hypothetical protein
MARTRGNATRPITDYVYECNSPQPLATIPLAFEDFDAPLIGEGMAAAPHYEAVVEVAPSGIPVASAAAAVATGRPGPAGSKALPSASASGVSVKKRSAGADAGAVDNAAGGAPKRLRSDIGPFQVLHQHK